MGTPPKFLLHIVYGGFPATMAELSSGAETMGLTMLKIIIWPFTENVC